MRERIARAIDNGALFITVVSGLAALLGGVGLLFEWIDHGYGGDFVAAIFLGGQAGFIVPFVYLGIRWKCFGAGPLSDDAEASANA